MGRAQNFLQQQELSVVTSWSCLDDDKLSWLELWLRASQHLLQSTEVINPSHIQSENNPTLCCRSFVAMRFYLREIGKCPLEKKRLPFVHRQVGAVAMALKGLERVDPHLCNNAGLVTRLVDAWIAATSGGSGLAVFPETLQLLALLAALRIGKRAGKSAHAMFRTSSSCFFDE